MDLTSLKGLGPARRDKLADDAGIEGVWDLAGEDPAELAERVDVPEGILEGFVDQATGIQQLQEVEGISDEALHKLVEAGVRSPEELRSADPTEVSAAAGLDTERVGGWQDALAARDTPETHEVDEEPTGAEEPAPAEIDESAGEPGEAEAAAEPTAEGSAVDELAERLAHARVVLEEGIADARVKFEDEVLAQARILPLKAREDAEEFLEEVEGNVVVLRESADEALVRVEDRVEDGLPVFKEKLDEAAEQAEEGVREVRVQVEEIRDKELIPSAGELKQKVKDLLGLD